MVKYLYAIFYLCVVMFLNLAHQLAKGETCDDGYRDENKTVHRQDNSPTRFLKTVHRQN